MRIGIGVSEDLPIPDQRGLARDVEAAGAASLWTNEAAGRDALLLCQAWAQATTELQVGVGVLPIWTRTPAQLAMAVATLQESSEGRFLLGLGVSHPGTMGPWHGVTYRKPLTAARELLAILADLLTEGSADREGEVLRARFTLAVTPRPPRPTTYLAAMGPRMLALAGAQADGVLLNWSCSQEVERAGAVVRSAGQDAGRTAPEVAAYVRVAVAPDRSVARAALAREFGSYCALPAYAAHFARQGAQGAVDAVKAAYRDGGAQAVPDAVDDESLGRFGWWGTPQDDLRAGLAPYAAAGLDHLVARVVRVGDDARVSVAHVLDALG